MMTTVKRAGFGLLFSFLLAASFNSFAAYSVLDLPAVKSDLATTSLIYAIERNGDRFFATGIRGHILYSDDKGETWTQAEVPVRSSILDINFPTSEKGWAVGHEGVILHSSDGGETWVKQYDGFMYSQQGVDYYTKLLEEDPENEILQIVLEEMEFALTQGADKPFFRVIFHNENRGNAFGAYGMMLATFDAGKTWVHREHLVDNYGFNHLFDATKVGNGLFFACGEIGLVLEGNLTTQTTTALATPWEGSFFTCMTAADDSIVMSGLRGNVFRSDDRGRSWLKVDKPASSSIVDSRLLSDGRVVLAGQDGELMISSDNGLSFSMIPLKGIGQISAITEVDSSTLLIAGPKGIHKVSLEQ